MRDPLLSCSIGNERESSSHLVGGHGLRDHGRHVVAVGRQDQRVVGARQLLERRHVQLGHVQRRRVHSVLGPPQSNSHCYDRRRPKSTFSRLKPRCRSCGDQLDRSNPFRYQRRRTAPCSLRRRRAAAGSWRAPRLATADLGLHLGPG